MGDTELIPGKEYRVTFPFVTEKIDMGGYCKAATESLARPSSLSISSCSDVDGSWKPGVRWVPCSPEDYEAVADAEGVMILTVVDTHKPPGRYAERVFYTRKWIDPDGVEFGHDRLLIISKGAFSRRASGYYHEYRIAR